MTSTAKIAQNWCRQNNTWRCCTSLKCHRAGLRGPAFFPFLWREIKQRQHASMPKSQPLLKLNISLATPHIIGYNSLVLKRIDFWPSLIFTISNSSIFDWSDKLGLDRVLQHNRTGAGKKHSEYIHHRTAFSKHTIHSAFIECVTHMWLFSYPHCRLFWWSEKIHLY